MEQSSAILTDREVDETLAAERGWSTGAERSSSAS